MKVFKILVFMFILIMSAGAVCATDASSDNHINDTLETAQNDVYTAEVGSFADLQNDIDNAENTLEITKDYMNTDYKTVIIEKDNFIINGNNHTLDGNKKNIFLIGASNVTINNLIFTNTYESYLGGAINNMGTVALNNVSFVNDSAVYGGAIYNSGVMEVCGATFIDNSADYGNAIYNGIGAELSISNAFFSSKISGKLGQIVCSSSNIAICNSTFLNITSSYSPALYIKSSNVSIINSRFENLTADISAGAIAIKTGGNYYIEGCEFVNTTSSKNAGALNIDISGLYNSSGDVVILNTLFEDTYSDFGGAFIQLGGNLLLNNSNFINNGATYKGGSVYISYADAEIDNCTFDSNGVRELENVADCGGAIYCDMSNLTLTNSRIINKSMGLGSAVYACDSSYSITNSIFIDNANAVYTDFDKAGNLANNVYGNGSVSTNNTYLKTIMLGEGMELKLLNNTINVTNLPSRFDLRDWNWTSPVKNQGLIGACWAFGATEALESALRKAYGITIDFSINNMQKTMIRYSNYGMDYVYDDEPTAEGGSIAMSASYLVSWLGVFSQDYDLFDEVGKISRVIKTGEDIHIQDLIFAYNDEPGSLQMKLAILKYGSLSVNLHADNNPNPYFNPETNAQYVYENIGSDHIEEIVGWDDNYSKDNFLIAPPGDGAWIIKNSWSPDWGDNGYMYLSYYDKSLLRKYFGDEDNMSVVEFGALGVIVENTVPYNKNYQYDVGWNRNFDDWGNVTYANVFEALDDDLIAAVGTYSSKYNADCKVDIYVNGELKLTQESSLPYAGFHTIKLDEYIPIKKGDVFKVVMTSNSIAVLYFEDTRVHYTQGLSYKFENGSWVDLYDEGKIACLKVYTVADDSKIIDNMDIQADYGSGSSFSVRVVTADGHAVVGGDVNFTINGKTTTVKTDKNGMANIRITQAPGKYTVKTAFNAKTCTNKVTVKHVLKTSKVTVKKTARKFTLKAKLKINGKPIKGKWITFKFNGKTYKAKTNFKGIAQKTLNKKVIKKLKKGKTYTVRVTYVKDTIKTTVKVK